MNWLRCVTGVGLFAVAGTLAGCASDVGANDSYGSEETVAETSAKAVSAIASTVIVPGGPCGATKLGANCQAYFPDVVKDPKGDADDLLMVYRWSSAHTNKPSQLRMMRSRDGGVNWEQAKPFIVADSGDLDFRDPSLTALRSGRLLLSYFVQGTNVAIQSQVRYRDEDDAVFSAAARVYSSTIPSPVTSAKIAELSNGQLLIPLYGTPTGGDRHHSVVVSSLDGGVTWDGRLTGRQKTIAASDDLNYQEPAIAEITPGHVRAIIRVATSTGATAAAVQTDSYDGDYMREWSTPSSLGVMMHGPEILTIPGTNMVPYLWSQPNTATSPTYRPTLVAIRHTNTTWPSTPRRTLYNPASGVDSGYAGTVALDTNRLVTVVYDVSRRAAIALRYNVTDVD